MLKAVSEKVAEIIQDEIYPSPEVVVQTEVVVQNQELEKFGHRWPFCQKLKRLDGRG